MARIVDREYEGFKKNFRDVRMHVDVGLKFYHARRTDSDARFHDVFELLNSLLGPAQEHQQKLAQRAHEFDFVHADGKPVKANGYRSMLFLLRCCLVQLHATLQKCAKDRGGVFYMPVDYLSNLTAHCRALQGLELLLRYAAKLLEGIPSSSFELFNDGEMSLTLKKMACSEYMCRDVFYGRCLGFQYPSTMKPVLKMLAIGMASYESWYQANKDDPIRQLLQSLWKGSKYWQNPTQMGMKLDSLTQDCSVFFTKAFWSINEQEAVKTAMHFISQSVEISQMLEIPAKNITIQGSKGEVSLTPPFSELGYRPIPLLLVSYKWRQGQQRSQSSKKQPAPPSKGLIVHIHGGGFVAQSPKSHESYLRVWSRELDTPVVSIEYSLAPEAPFPRSLNECVMAYAWILQHLDQLGTTGEQIVFAGDSAGGTFVITASMKLKELGLRLPDRILSCYPSTITRTSASPSRFMTLVDPILPIGILLSCQQAYTGHLPSEEVLKMRRESRRKILRAKGYYIPDPDAESASSPVPIKKSDKKKKKKKKGKEEEPEDKPEDQPKSVPPPRPPPPNKTPSSSMKQQVDGTYIDTATNGAATNSTEEGITDITDTDSNPSSTDLTTQNGSASNPSPNDLLSDVSPGSKRKSLQEVDLSSFDQLTANESDPLLLGESSGHSNPETGGAEEVDGGTTGKEKEGAKKRPLLRATSALISLRQEPLKEDCLSPADIDQLVDGILKSFEDPEITRDPYMSPALAPDEMLIGLPAVHLVGCTLDPLLDDTIIMAQRLKAAGQPVTLNVMDNIPHGFLCFVTAGNDPDLQAAQRLCLTYLQQGLGKK